MKVKHFSSKSNLTELDPSFMGSGSVRGAQYKRGLPEHKTTFFYTHESKPEDIVVSTSPHQYEADLSGKSIYDLDTDKDNFANLRRGANLKKPILS